MARIDYLALVKWRVVKMTGWTLDYIDSLSIGRLYEFLQVEDGMSKVKG